MERPVGTPGSHPSSTEGQRLKSDADVTDQVTKVLTSELGSEIMSDPTEHETASAVQQPKKPSRVGYRRKRAGQHSDL